MEIPQEHFSQEDIERLESIANKGTPLRYFTRFDSLDQSYHLLMSQNRICLLLLNQLSQEYSINFLVKIGQTFNQKTTLFQLQGEDGSIVDFKLPLQGTVMDLSRLDKISQKLQQNYLLIFLPFPKKGPEHDEHFVPTPSHKHPPSSTD